VTSGPLPDQFDEALALLKDTGPEFQDNHYSNHGPMAAEALGRLGRPDLIVPWVERYRTRLDVHPSASRPIESDYRAAIGDLSRFGDWVAFFDREIAQHGWQAALDLWVGRLSPGVAAAATHGVIRTAHAVRALADREDAARRHEVAEGLGYWAARYHPVIAHERRPVGPPSKALGALPLAPHPATSNIMNTVATVAVSRSFQTSASVVDVGLSTDAFLDDLTVGFAHAYLSNVRGGSRAFIAFIHGVTGPRAVRLLLTHVSPDVGRGLLRSTWLAAAAIYEGFAEHPFAFSDESAIDVDPEDLIDRAVATGDEHAINLPRPVSTSTSELGKQCSSSLRPMRPPDCPSHHVRSASGPKE
jgi:hypothetical protein